MKQTTVFRQLIYNVVFPVVMLPVVMFPVVIFPVVMFPVVILPVHGSIVKVTVVVLHCVLPWMHRQNISPKKNINKDSRPDFFANFLFFSL